MAIIVFFKTVQPNVVYPFTQLDNTHMINHIVSSTHTQPKLGLFWPMLTFYKRDIPQWRNDLTKLALHEFAKAFYDSNLFFVMAPSSNYAALQKQFHLYSSVSKAGENEDILSEFDHDRFSH